MRHGCFSPALEGGGSSLLKKRPATPSRCLPPNICITGEARHWQNTSDAHLHAVNIQNREATNHCFLHPQTQELRPVRPPSRKRPDYSAAAWGKAFRTQSPSVSQAWPNMEHVGQAGRTSVGRRRGSHVRCEGGGEDLLSGPSD